MSERIQLLDDLGAEFARVTTEAESRSQARSGLPQRLLGRDSRTHTATVAAALTILLGGTAYAVPATRGTVDGLAASLAGWVQGDTEDAPGRVLRHGDNAPSWFSEDPVDSRLIAETDGVGLFMRRTTENGIPMLQFGLGQGLVIGGPLESWRQRMGKRAVVVLPGSAAFGPRDLLDEQGRFPLLGVTTRDVTRLELQYAKGAPLVADNGDGGFVLLADAWRPLRELIAYDETGQVRERIDLTDYDMSRHCDREPGCPPEATSSRR